MRNASNVPELEQLRQIAGLSEKCLYLLNNIQKKLLYTHEIISKGFENEEQLINLKQKLEHLSKSITEDYEKIEDESKVFPSQMPPLAIVNRLHGFLMDVATNTCGMDAFINAQEVFDWSDSTAVYLKFLCELLKHPSMSNARARKLIVTRPNGVENSNLLSTLSLQNTQLENPQRRFESNFQSTLQHHNQENVRSRFLYRYLERSNMSCILELKLMSGSISRDYVTADKQPVCMLKFLLLVNNGVFEYVQFIAPHEDWTYSKSTHKQLDLSVESRYDLYRRMSVQGNIIMNAVVTQYFQHPIERNGASFLLGYFSCLYIFDQPCKQCKKILKDFSPTIVSDRKLSYHHSCK